MEIHLDGEVYNCCPAWIKHNSIGNIYENKFEEIWYSEKATEIRKSIVEGCPKYCDRDICDSWMPDDKKIDLEAVGYPEIVKFCHDSECNYKCVMCRDKLEITETETLNLLNNKIDDFFLPMLKNVRVAEFSGNGDPFVSRHYRALIKAAAIEYPNLKFDIQTNGSLCDEENIKELGLFNRIQNIDISMHSAKAKTYEVITRTKLFNKLMKNLKYLSKLKKEGKIDNLNLAFVVQKSNYKELVDFVKLAKKLDAKALIWNVRQVASLEMDKNFDEVAIFRENHPKFKDFKKILQNPIFKSSNCYLPPELQKLIG